MAKVHRSYRLEEETVRRVSEWAEEHGKTTTQAMEELLAAALGAGDVAEVGNAGKGASTLEVENESLRAQRDILRDHLADTRQHLSTLTAQLAEKDRQIERLHDIAEHSQMLEAAHVAGTISGDVAHDVSQDASQGGTQESTRPRGVWAWLARKIEGR